MRSIKSAHLCSVFVSLTHLGKVDAHDLILSRNIETDFRDPVAWISPPIQRPHSGVHESGSFLHDPSPRYLLGTNQKEQNAL